MQHNPSTVRTQLREELTAVDFLKLDDVLGFGWRSASSAAIKNICFERGF
jgi:hypothetical protein